MVVCLLGTFALLTLFAQLRFQKETSYRADFTNVSGLQAGDFVRIAGVEVGKVKNITLNDQRLAVVEFTADDSVVLTERLRSSRSVRQPDRRPIPGASRRRRQPCSGSPPDRRYPWTAPSRRWTSTRLLGGFRPLFRALDPEQVNMLTGQLIHAFQGQGATISSFLSQTAAVTDTLADRDALIGQVIGNLDTVLGSLGDQGDQFAKAVDSLSELVDGLAGSQDRRQRCHRLHERRLRLRGRHAQPGPGTVEKRPWNRQIE